MGRQKNNNMQPPSPYREPALQTKAEAYGNLIRRRIALRSPYVIEDLNYAASLCDHVPATDSPETRVMIGIIQGIMYCHKLLTWDDLLEG